MQSPGKLRLPALACSAVFLLCELISRPWAEVGVSDDWSYIHSAQVLAQTGHIVYVGWASAIVGWQLYLGAGLIKLFGFSFTAPRIGTLLIAVSTVYLMQRTLVRFGIEEGPAALGTLTFVLSPLFMQLSATMMSDVPGFFSVLACIYGCVRALQSLRDRDAILWLSLAVAVNAICGTSRQICWLGVLVLVPSTLWLLRSRRSVFLSGLAATAGGFLFVFAALHWFNTQPYALPEPASLAPFHLWAWKLLTLNYIRSLLEIVLLLSPLALPYIAAVRRFSVRNFAVLAALIASCAAFLFYLGRKPALLSLRNPFMGDWVGPRAIFDSAFLVSQSPTVLHPVLVRLLAAFAIVALLSIVATIFIARPPVIQPRTAGSFTWRHLGILFGPLTLVYFLLLSRHGVWQIYDRYLFTPIFIALVCLLLDSQQHLKTRWPVATYAAVAAIAFYGIISTHNLFAFNRARVTLANEVLATGLPPSHADFGWEMNGWYELQLSPYINEPHIVRPAGTYHLFHEPQRSGCHEATTYGFFRHIAPRYGIAYSPHLCDGPAPFAPVSYATWPLRQPTTLYVVKYPAPWRSALETESSPTTPETHP